MGMGNIRHTRWHRVIVKQSKQSEAIKWLDDMNVVAHMQSFNDDYFDSELNTIQFIFKESDNSDLTCAEKFAKVYSTMEVRSYDL